MQLTDTHAHVNVRHFDNDRSATIERAFQQGISRIICPGTDVTSSRSAIELAQQYPGRIFAATGIHPHDTTDFNQATLAEIRELSMAPEVVAIGEIGIDYFRNLAPVAAQREAFAAQVALAQERNLPIIVHNRDAHADIMAELRSYGTIRGVWHCFIGDRQMAEEGLALGMYLSFAGPVTYPANTTLMDVAAWAPLDRILVETDSPYLTPHPHRRDRNEPANVAQTAQKIAELRGISLEELSEATSANATTLFHLPTMNSDVQKLSITGAN